MEPLPFTTQLSNLLIGPIWSAATRQAFRARLARLPDEYSHEINTALTKVLQRQDVDLLDALLTKTAFHDQIARRLVLSGNWATFAAVIPRFQGEGWPLQALDAALKTHALSTLLKHLDLPTDQLWERLASAVRKGDPAALRLILDRGDAEPPTQSRQVTQRALAWGRAVEAAAEQPGSPSLGLLLAHTPQGSLTRAVRAVAFAGLEEALDRLLAQSTVPTLGHLRSLASAVASVPTSTLHAQAPTIAEQLARRLPLDEQRVAVAQFPDLLPETRARLRQADLAQQPARPSTRTRPRV